MHTINITKVIIPNPPVAGFHVSTRWRYGTEGTFFVVAATSFVASDGTIASPIVITYDETINPQIQIAMKYTDSPSCPEKLIPYTYTPPVTP